MTNAGLPGFVATAGAPFGDAPALTSAGRPPFGAAPDLTNAGLPFGEAPDLTNAGRPLIDASCVFSSSAKLMMPCLSMPCVSCNERFQVVRTPPTHPTKSNLCYTYGFAWVRFYSKIVERQRVVGAPCRSLSPPSRCGGELAGRRWLVGAPVLRLLGLRDQLRARMLSRRLREVWAGTEVIWTPDVCR